MKARPLNIPFFTPGVWIVFSLALIGASAYLYRMFFGLAEATNLTNSYPWGIWIAIDVASGVALAAGGFTSAALAEIFHREKYHVILRPALLTAMLGYTFVVIGLLADLGRYYNVWHPMIPTMWQGNSVLFEVGLCVMAYLNVLYSEFAPIVVDRFKGKVTFKNEYLRQKTEGLLTFLDKFFRKILWVLIIAGVVLSCLHQSSLGTLMLIAPTKIHPLWYTPISPLLFWLSAVAVGYPMVIFESLLASKSFGIKPETHVLSSLAKIIPFTVGFYFAAKVIDITIREAWPFVGEGSLQSYMFIFEMALFAIPLILLTQEKIRQSVRGLFISSALVVSGVVINRINVFLIAYHPPYTEEIYLPSIYEIAVTVGLICALVLVYRFLTINLPIVTIEDGE
ncbi:MAG: polysulfide reductase [Bdellovibrionales bacterium RIFOXYD12_FULL_39_22]|nr:MAG: polysulfide reductase [Bdellovibrionales bacterium RIFOXYB1_FULL_39_21]OFZ43822.1 MAG: polysulfide reductase [Bdellovibrionales bacterium RIFOXYC12_FULL_39_17]OFZ48844.1 MAG: polysulfide reductase [Bdellovibrionales bacterium RIFOXYC1_FULL_39_130]OFZ72069.1 MAG: polysulfide reductase [Bdellovibrionales bacterium RIFOXYC2_FULL_39_8]OFZ76577.1 MAG: polysulfide reductase [Bdellovibrionales bacterium RIFOXYD1_FULL_39_84]OFZ94811.1 MAG: polysulfide reductase [Bdellovibrionales bacterium RIF